MTFGRHYRELVRGTRSAFRLRMDVEDTIAQDDKVVIRLKLNATHTGNFIVPPSGKKFSISAIGILRFEDGQLIERWNVSDLYGLLEQIGLAPGQRDDAGP